jgi:hypothetical protein
MKILLTVTLLIGGLLFYRLKFSAGGDDLQGRWTIVSAPEGWRIVPGTDMMVTGDEIQIRLGTVVTSKMRYSADSEAGTIDATASDGRIHRGLYHLDNNTLTLSVGAAGKARPENLEASGDGIMRWVLRRGTRP